MLVLTNTSTTPYVIVIFFFLNGEHIFESMWHVAVNVTNRWGIHTRGTGRWQAQ